MDHKLEIMALKKNFKIISFNVMDILNYIRTKGASIVWFKKMFMPVNRYIRRCNERKMNKLFTEQSEYVFSKICDSLSNEIPFWPEFGTLLGIYRDNDFIKHDCDFDFGAYVENAELIKEKLLANGFTLESEYIGIDNDEIREMTFTYNGIGIDFFYFTEMRDCMTCFVFHPYKIDLIGTNTIYKIKPFYFPYFKLEKSIFKGQTISIPVDTAKHLEYSYGPNFMIPDPNFKSIHNEYLTDSYAKKIIQNQI